jgi:hypothetical protein
MRAPVSPEVARQSCPSLREKPLVECRLDLEFVDGLPDGRFLVRRVDVVP